MAEADSTDSEALSDVIPVLSDFRQTHMCQAGSHEECEYDSDSIDYHDDNQDSDCCSDGYKNQDENCDGCGGDMHGNVTNAVVDSRTDDEWETQGTHTDPDVKLDASSSSGEGAVKGKCAPKCQDSGPDFDSDSTDYDDDNQDPDYCSDDDTDDTNVDDSDDNNDDDNDDCGGGGGDMHENVTNAAVGGRADNEKETQGTHTDTGVKHDASSSSEEGVKKEKCHVPKFSGKVWDKKHACVYCMQLYSKMARHLEQVHKDELEVAKALSFPKRSKERQKLWLEIRNKGDFAYNRRVIAEEEGQLITAKRPAKDLKISNFVPCPRCLGMFQGKDLWRHAKKCKLNKDEAGLSKRGDHQREGKLLLPVAKGIDDKFHREILGPMKNDHIREVASRDTLILMRGQKVFAKCATQTHQYQYVRQKVRELARFLIEFRKLDAVESLQEAVDPTKYKTCVEAVRNMCGIDMVKGSCKTPSTALKVGHALKKCARILKSKALQAQDESLKKRTCSFIDLLDEDWATDISTVALQTMQVNRFNKPKRLPLTKDIQKLHAHLEERAQDLLKQLSESKTDNMSVWRDLSEVTLAQIVLFNRRRGGEAQRIEVEQVQQGLSAKNLQEEIMHGLSTFEQALAKKLERIEIRGKRGRRVPVLLTERHKQQVECLIRKRPHDVESRFLFPRGTHTSTPLSTSDILRTFSRECGAEQPDLLTSTSLRKQIATMSQILNLKDHELDALADFLGHDIRVHRQFYRLSEDTVQVAKISKLLLELESGRLVRHKGKTLDEIQVDEEEEIQMDEEEEEHGLSDDEDKKDEVTVDPGISSNPESSGSHQKESKPRAKRRKTGERRTWSTAEKEAVKRQLGKYFRLKKIPGKVDCETAKRNEPTLHGRSWTQIKFCVKNNI